MKQDMKEQLLTKRPIDLLFQLSIPAVIGMIVIGLYPLMDGIFAGNIIGQTATFIFFFLDFKFFKFPS